MNTHKNRARTFLVRLLIFEIFIYCFTVAHYKMNTGKMLKNSLSAKYTVYPDSYTRSLDRSRLKNAASLPANIPFTYSEPAYHIESVPSVFPGETDAFDEVQHDENVIVVNKRSISATERFYEDTKPVKSPDNRCNMREELISLDDLDYGRYRAMISRDHDNKSNIDGFLYIAATWGQQLRIPDTLKRSVINLAEAVTRYTGIRVGLDSHLMLDSHRLHSAPFVFITTNRAFELTPAERENFGAYLCNGGFAFIDNGTPEYPRGQAEASLRKMLRDSLGAHARFLPVPVSHPVYHSFFDFEDGPPLGDEVQSYTTDTRSTGCSGECRRFTMNRPVHYLEGIWVDGRLVAIYSDKGYSHKWILRSNFFVANNVPQLKMGVNLVVFAMNQRDGIAKRNSERYF